MSFQGPGTPAMISSVLPALTEADDLKRKSPGSNTVLISAGTPHVCSLGDRGAQHNFNLSSPRTMSASD